MGNLLGTIFRLEVSAFFWKYTSLILLVIVGVNVLGVGISDAVAAFKKLVGFFFDRNYSEIAIDDEPLNLQDS